MQKFAIMFSLFAATVAVTGAASTNGRHVSTIPTVSSAKCCLEPPDCSPNCPWLKEKSHNDDNRL